MRAVQNNLIEESKRLAITPIEIKDVELAQQSTSLIDCVTEEPSEIPSVNFASPMTPNFYDVTTS